MMIYSISSKPLYMQSCSIFAYSALNALFLILVTDKSSPCLLDSHSCSSTFELMLKIYQTRLVVSLKKRKYFVLTVVWASEGVMVVVVYHS